MRDEINNLIERVRALETRQKSISYVEGKILEIAHNIVRLKTANFYIEDTMDGPKKHWLHPSDVGRYVKMFERNLMIEIGALQAAKCD